MKKLTLTLAWCSLLTLGNAYGQNSDNENRDAYLRNYKAPNFKQSRLGVNLKMSGSGEEASSNFSENTRLTYFRYANMEDYQGELRVDVNSRLGLRNQVEINSYSSSHGISNATLNRFFFRNAWFVGAHNSGAVSYSENRSESLSNSDRYNFNFQLRPAISIGNGRLEPVQYARNAWDIERSLKMGDELGGHIVSGHVDGVAELIELRDEGDSTRMTFRAPEDLARFIAPKGSITLNGTSLTVNEVDGCTFGVNVIPHTQKVTTWGDVKEGDVINLEIDTMARYVARLREFG